MTEDAGQESGRGVLFDRDGTLVVNVPYNGMPDRVVPMPGARALVTALRSRGFRIGVISNQSGIARGLLTADEVAAVNQRVDSLLGPFDVWKVCPHGPEDDCPCRKPRPGMILDAASELGLDARNLTVVGDIGADVEAARAAGARGILVPTAETLQEEVAAAEEVAVDLHEIHALLLAEPRVTAHGRVAP
jgi:HAD superfamily hydrolase (TIGR01662 family)